MAWPDHFPQSCPPQDAEPRDHEVFRVVTHNPPQLDDFKSHVIRYPHKPWTTDELKCQACGISVTQTEKRAIELKKKIEGGMVAKGSMSPEVGVSKNTGKRGHITWWIYKDCEPNYGDFVVVNQP